MFKKKTKVTYDCAGKQSHGTVVDEFHYNEHGCKVVFEGTPSSKRYPARSSFVPYSVLKEGWLPMSNPLHKVSDEYIK